MNCIHLSACVLSHQRNRENRKTGICSSAHQLFDLYFKLDSCAGQPGKKSCQYKHIATKNNIIMMKWVKCIQAHVI